jgi:pimeloyl-ACP methyl ester carboxylesterase
MRCALLILVSLASCARGAAPTPPEQPQSGPGGKQVAHTQVRAELHGSGPQAYWLFEPAEPTPETAPLIAFNHGWGAMDPRTYRAWINHIVRRGNIVVYPLYQDSLRSAANTFTPNAIAAVHDAIRTLQSEPGHVKPQLDKFALVGHSMGGPISANMAATWETEGLPVPRAIMCVEPGKTWGRPWAVIGLSDLKQIPADTLLLSVVGEDDRLVRDVDAKRIFNESTQVPLENKNFITLVSDDHGSPALRANHMAPVAWTNRTVDALDYFGLWKLFDGLTDAAFFRTHRNYALGDTPEQRFMGVWSDGVPVKPMRVTAHP